MKIKISFEDWERRCSAIAVAALRRVLPGVKVKECNQKAPVNIIYLTTGKQKGPRVHKENT